ncbi:MAG: sigma-70 region 4 domain-containing protein [Lysobacteraceae bacterium]
MPTEQGAGALTAFLRGIERRGRVLAEAQCGDPERAQTAIAMASAAFRKDAPNLPLMQWPSHFWQLLLAQPALRIDISAHDNVLAQLSPGPRAALLLRLVAGLDQEHGAEVLRVSPEAYRHALYRALKTLHDQGIDDARLRDLRAHLQQCVKQAPEAVQQTLHASGVAGSIAATMPHVRRWQRSALIGLLAILLAALAASFFWQPAFLRSASSMADNVASPSSSTQSPALPTTASVMSDPDFDLLDDPDGERIARDLDLLSWYAAGADTGAPVDRGTAPLPESATPETSAPETEATPQEGHDAP